MLVSTPNTVTETNNSKNKSFSSASLFTFCLTVMVLISLIAGWELRNEYLLTAEYGLGYALGIVGSSMMLLLLAYPLKKRFQNNSFFILSTKNWFKLHMVLGVLGPLLVLFHSNFSLGSTNSNVALFSMLLMVASGLVGRFIYGKIHYGLYGNKIELAALIKNKLAIKEQLEKDNTEVSFINDHLKNKLEHFEVLALKQRGLLSSLYATAILSISTRINHRSLIRLLKQDLQSNQSFMALPKKQKHLYFTVTCKHISEYLFAIRKIAGLNFFERLFSLWHMLHLPIFFMLIITGFVHVYAVHMY